ncbi:hypothetical protein L596_027485 [Steinernema carpocapsae]|uniref:MAM domain-containing protein n=1 Tax=Steinernema carpocapsae TaxID=34508 RepID=A0A4U5LVL7_STECR|nr:hypothetical protein L596_027485 [Steinernema carpocapsae]
MPLLLLNLVFVLTCVCVTLACQPLMEGFGQTPNLHGYNYGNYYNQQQPQAVPPPAFEASPPLHNGVAASANSLDENAFNNPVLEWTTEAPMSPFGNLEGVDCSNGIRTPLEFLECTDISEFKDSSEDGDAGSVFCNFRKSERCRFHNSPGEKISFRRAKFRSTSERFEQIFRQMVRRPDASMPNGGFIFVGEPFGKPKEYEAAIEAKIKCQKDDGKLRFRHWKTSENITLRVCTRDSEMRSCTQSINYDFEEVYVNVVNPRKFPFWVEILVSGFTSPSLFAVDDLQYEADFCTLEAEKIQINQNTLPAAALADPTFQSSFPIEKEGRSLVAVRIQPQPQPYDSGTLQISYREASQNDQNLQIHKISNCELLNCDFSSDLCKYHNGKSDLFGNKYGEWKVAKGRMGNFLTGIRTNETPTEGYAFVGTDNSNDSIKGRRIYVLESSPLSLDSDSTLLFDMYRRARAISLQICLDSLTNCPYEIPQIDKRIFWRKNEKVTIPKRTKKLFFVATQWQKFKWLAIANVRVESSSCQV